MSENIEKYAWEIQYPRECKQLPYTYLEEDEKNLVDKCINQEEFTEDEKAQLKLLLNRYRPHLKDYDSEKVEKNIEKTENIVRTQSELLRIIHDPEIYRIDMYHWVNGKKYLLQMRIKPFTDKQYLEGIGDQLGLFRDLTIDERKLMSKAEMKQPMTPEEQKMHKALVDKINEKFNDNTFNVEIVTKFIADRVEFIGDENTTFEENVKFWEQVDLNTRAALFYEIRGRLRLSDTFEEELFPAPR